jgi:hypothetical protein
MSHRPQHTEARRESVQTSRRRCGLHAVAKTASRVALLRHGDVRWLALGVVLEALSYALSGGFIGRCCPPVA